MVSARLPGSGLCPDATAKMVSATKRVGISVFGGAECITMLPGKWPPQIAAVSPGSSSVVGCDKSFKLADGDSFRFAQTESTSVIYTGHLKVADQSAHVLNAKVRNVRWQETWSWSQRLRVKMRMRYDDEFETTEVCDLKSGMLSVRMLRTWPRRGMGIQQNYGRDAR